MRSNQKYTKEILETLAKSASSVADVLRALGLKLSGGNHLHIKNRLKHFGIDISHFKGAAWNKGIPARNALPPDVVFVYNRSNGRREHRQVLRRSMLAKGVREVCAICEQGTMWRNEPLVIHIDHIDGNFINNVFSNLRFLCSYCHSQTETFSGKSRKPVRVRACTTCYKPIAQGQRKYCSSRSKTKKPRPTKIVWPSDTDLAERLQLVPALAVAAELGVSSVAIKKHCKRRGIPTPPRGYWAKRAAGKL